MWDKKKKGTHAPSQCLPRQRNHISKRSKIEDLARMCTEFYTYYYRHMRAEFSIPGQYDFSGPYWIFHIR